MAFKATFSHGDPRMVDYTPGADVAAGDVVVLSNAVRIAHHGIPANTLGALGAGNGVYDIVRTTGASTGWADGDAVYWDATAQAATKTSTSNKRIGLAVGAAADADATGRVQHTPN